MTSLRDIAPDPQCNRFKAFKARKGIKPDWCTTCRAFLGRYEKCPVFLALKASP